MFNRKITYLLKKTAQMLHLVYTRLSVIEAKVDYMESLIKPEPIIKSIPNKTNRTKRTKQYVQTHKKILEIKSNHPNWNYQQIARKAKVSGTTASRHLKRSRI